MKTKYYLRLSELVLPGDCTGISNRLQAMRAMAFSNDDVAINFVRTIINLYTSPIRPLYVEPTHCGMKTIRTENYCLTAGYITETIYTKLKEAFRDHIKDKEVLASQLLHIDTIATVPGFHVVNPDNHFDLVAGMVFESSLKED